MMRPLDANDNTSLRAVVEWANANPQSGNWNMNRVEANFAPIAGGTITLDPALATLELESNFNFHGAELRATGSQLGPMLAFVGAALAQEAKRLM